jgi:hypothetical protein
VAIGKPQYLTIENPKTGKQDAPIVIEDIESSPYYLTRPDHLHYTFSILPGQCVGTLMPGAKCKLAVTYTPYQGPGLPYEAQKDTGGITITDNGSTQPVIYLSGINFLRKIRYRPKTLDFGRQRFNTTGAPLTVEVTNPNTVAVSLGSVGTQGGLGQFPCFGIDFTASTCYNATSANFIVPPNATCTVGVAYTASKIGSQSGVLFVQSYSGPVFSIVKLHGYGTK